MTRRSRALAMFLILGWALGSCTSEPPPTVVLPPSDQQLDPYLRQLIDRQAVVVRATPGNAENHGTLGAIYEANELWQLARRCYENAARLDDRDPSWPHHRAICLEGAGQLEDAELSFRTLTTEFPGFGPAWFELGVLLLRRGATEDAAGCFEAARARAPVEPTPRAGLADCLIRTERYQEAVTLLEEAIALAPRYGQAHHLLGLAYRGLGQTDLARRHLKQGIDAPRERLSDRVGRRVPGYRAAVPSVVAQAVALIQEGRTADGARLLENLLSLHPEEISVMNNLANAYNTLGRLAEATQLLDRALRLDPTNFRSHLNRSLIEISSQQLDQALVSVQAASQYAPQSPDAQFAVADVLMRMGRYEEARAPLEATLTLDPDMGQAWHILAEVHLRAGRLPEARQATIEAVRLNPGELRLLANLALIECQMGEWDSARGRLATLRAKAPNHGKIPAVERALALEPGKQ